MSTSEITEFVERIARLEDEKKELADDIRSIFKEAEVKGLNVKALRAAVKVYRLPEEERPFALATLETLDTYLSALGFLADTELGRAAVKRIMSNITSTRAGGSITPTPSA
jgi:uncharacterized protein (UPF0335 family)